MEKACIFPRISIRGFIEASEPGPPGPEIADFREFLFAALLKHGVDALTERRGDAISANFYSRLY